VNALTIYLEGDSHLRQGMEQFLVTLKDKVRAKRWKWKLSAMGGRKKTYDAFMNARRLSKPGEIIVLLVDSEAPVAAGATRKMHLLQRQGDGWDLENVEESHIHLMVQTMETWIVADLDALAIYYGQHFEGGDLPTRKNLEEEPKTDCERKLAEATRRTQKGKYHKTNHAPQLLGKISPDKVRLRCPHADTLFSTLSDLIG
jgi:hypothetical protein